MSPLEVLHTYWGYETFRPMQEEIIREALEGRDVLAILPTGGGKSVCFHNLISLHISDSHMCYQIL